MQSNVLTVRRSWYLYWKIIFNIRYKDIKYILSYKCVVTVYSQYYPFQYLLKDHWITFLMLLLGGFSHAPYWKFSLNENLLANDA